MAALKSVVNADALAEDLTGNWAGDSSWARVNGSSAGLIPTLEDTDGVASWWAGGEFGSALVLRGSALEIWAEDEAWSTGSEGWAVLLVDSA